MPTLAIDFHWPVCVDGYEVVKVSAGAKGRSNASRILLGSPGSTLARERIEIRPKSDKIRYQNPVGLNPHLFSRFASLGDDVPGYVDFANTYGPLYGPAARMAEDTVSDWRDEIKRMHEACELRLRDYQASFSAEYMNKRLGTIGVGLVHGSPDRRPVMALIPDSLRSAMWLQFAQFVSSNRNLRSCDFCRIWFEVGGDTGKRTDSRFCSKDHKTAFHNLQKKAARK